MECTTSECMHVHSPTSANSFSVVTISERSLMAKKAHDPRPQMLRVSKKGPSSDICLQLKAETAQFELPPRGNSVSFLGYTYFFPGTIPRTEAEEQEKYTLDFSRRVFRCRFEENE